MSLVLTNGGWGARDVPYVIDNASFSRAERRVVRDAIRRWNRQAPTRLVRRTNQRDHLFFRKHPSSCSSPVGRRGGRQEVRCNVAGRTFGNVMHEIGHAMGLFHEHQRPDRNDFVRVTGTGINFDRQTSHGVAAIGRYDLGSIMHYSPSSNLRVRGSSGSTVGQRRALSNRDIAGLLWLRRDWQREPGVLAQISVSHDQSDLWGVNPKNEIFTKRIGERSWTRIGGSLRNVSVGPRDLIWGVNTKDEIFRRRAGSSAWTRVGGSLRWLSVGRDQTVWGANSKREIFRWRGNRWERISGRLAYVSVGSRRHVWGVNEKHEVFTRSGSSWRRIPGILKWISVGSDGTVWGVNPRNEIFMRDAADHWTKVSGSLMRVDVSDFGNVYGVNKKCEIFSYRE